MAQITTPHFALPFRMHRGATVCVEQDTLDDIAGCIEAVLRTSPGQRIESPEFGSPELTFNQRPLNLDDVVNRVELWEPRARILLSEDATELDPALARIRATVTLED